MAVPSHSPTIPQCLLRGTAIPVSTERRNVSYGEGLELKESIRESLKRINSKLKTPSEPIVIENYMNFRKKLPNLQYCYLSNASHQYEH